MAAATSRLVAKAAVPRWTIPWPDPRRMAMWIAFLAVYGILDHADAALSAGPLQPAPWDLSGGLAFAFLLLEGPWLAPFAALAEFVSARVASGGHAPLAADALSAAALALTYAPAAWLLRRRGAGVLARQWDLSALGLAAVAAAAVRAGADMMIAIWMSGTGHGHWAGIFGERFTACVAGVAVMAPLIMSLRVPARRVEVRQGLEMAAQFALLIATCVLVMPPAQADTFRYFYLLFLPQIWIATRGGIAAAALGNLVVQGALMAFLLNRPDTVGLSFNYQVRLLALAVSTLFLAVAVAERRAIEAALRQRQDALARVSRLSLAGEMAAALAHELNQPLLATIAFARAAQKLAGDGAEPRVGEALEGAVRQAERAGAIVKGLRRFVGRSERKRGSQNLEGLAREAIDLVELQRQQVGARILLVADRDLPLVMADGIQIQQVLVNLLQNALDSTAESGVGGRIVKLVARRSQEWVEVETRDSGPGVPPDLTETLFDPLVSGKPEGMGLGLSISRGVVEAHGGRLWLAENRPGRCVFRFTLPVASEAVA
jgi:two-component system sensor kinase FixL